MSTTTWHALPANEAALIEFRAAPATARSLGRAIARALRKRIALHRGLHLVGFGAFKPRLRVTTVGGRELACLYGIARTRAAAVAQAFSDVLRESTRLHGSSERRAPAKHRRRRRSSTGRRNPSERELRQADGKFREWHGFGPQHVTRIRVPAIPRALVRLGEIPRVYYDSNKWDRKRRTYVHHTSKPRPVLYTNPQGNRFFILGGRMRATERGLIH